MYKANIPPTASWAALLIAPVKANLRAAATIPQTPETKKK